MPPLGFEPRLRAPQARVLSIRRRGQQNLINNFKPNFIKSEKMNCISCGTDVRAKENWVKFECPKCGEYEILRCSTCKALSNPYKCPKCGFEGP